MELQWPCTGKAGSNVTRRGEEDWKRLMTEIPQPRLSFPANAREPHRWYTEKEQHSAVSRPCRDADCTEIEVKD